MRKIVVALAFVAAAAIAPSALALPGLTSSPSLGPPTTTVTLTGTGFDAGASIGVFYDTTQVALTVSNGSGGVSATVQIPSSAQPGRHWLTLDELRNHAAAQKAFVVTTPWAMQGFAASGRGFNPYENALGPANVGNLTQAWSAPAGNFSNPSPFVVYNGTGYVGDVTGHIHAYSSTGTLLWSAAPGTDLEGVTPVYYNGRVYFGGANGNVYAYAYRCRLDGGVCTPQWTHNVGTAVSGSLTIWKSVVYAPSSDGSVHPLNAATGAPGTPIYGFDNTHGPVTTPVSFGADGTFFYGAGNNIESRDAFGGSTLIIKGGTVSPIAVWNNAAYATANGEIFEIGGVGWTAPTSGTTCSPAPAVANNVVYAGGCGTIGAFEAGTGGVLWSRTTSGGVTGVSVATGVVYVCAYAGGAGRLYAYDAASGGTLWSGGYCTTPPAIVDGTLYAAYARLSAYTLAAAGMLPPINAVVPRPDPDSLTFHRNPS